MPGPCSGEVLSTAVERAFAEHAFPEQEGDRANQTCTHTDVGSKQLRCKQTRLQDLHPLYQTFTMRPPTQ
eukprot:4379948-Lingulodinium_polyedra.AAC.1